MDRSDVFYHLLKRNPDMSRRIMEASPFLNLPAHLERTGASYGDVMRTYGFDPEETALGQVQNRFRYWLESVVNGYDYGFNGAMGDHPGRFDAAELDCSMLEFYLEKLVPANSQLSKVLEDVSSLRGGADVKEVAGAAARFYSVLPSMTGGRGRPEKVAAPPAWEPDGEGPGMHAAALFEHLREKAQSAFDLLVLHGSLATRDYVEGCSDLDTFAVLKAEVCSSAEKILELREVLLESWEHFFRVDPFQHHGLMLASAQDAKFYPQHFFPLELLKFSKTVSGGDLEFCVRDSKFDELTIMHQILHGMLGAGGFEKESVHSAKRRVQMAILLPALLLMSEGKYTYKRDSFAAVSEMFGGEKLPALGRCSRIRARNAYGPAPPPGGKDWLLSYKRRALDAPPPPELASELGPLAGQLRELAARFAARLVSRSPDMPHIQSAFEWTDEPAPRSPQDYEAVKKSVSAKIEAHGNVSVLSQGSVSAPGISDLDLVISVRGRTRLPPLDDAAWDRMLNSSEKYLCAHRPFMVPEGMLDRIGQIWPVSGMGSEPDWKSHLFTAVETYALLGVMGRYPDSFASGRMEARSVLSHLYSTTYTLKILRACGAELAPGFEKEVRELRKDWFGLEEGARRSRLLGLWADSLGVHLGIIQELRKKIASVIEYPGGASGTLFGQAVFVRDWSPGKFMECASALAGAGRWAHVLPSEFLLVLCLYERAGGQFGDYLSAHMEHGVDLDRISCPGAEKLFYPRANLLGEAAARLREMGVRYVVLPTFSDGGDRPEYGGPWHSALSLAASGSAQDALVLGARAHRERAELEAKNAELRRAYDGQSGELRAMQQSLTFRLLRRYDSTLGKVLPLYRLARRASPPVPGAGPGFACPGPAAKKDVVCMPITEWGFRIQRTNHLMRRFAADGHRVFVVRPKLGPVDRFCRVSELEGGIYGLELDCAPLGIYADRISGPDLDRLESAFLAAAARLDLDPILFVSFPAWQPLASRLKEKLGCPVVFDVLDDFAQFSNVSSARAGEERKLAGEADLVLATSKALYEKCSRRGSALMLPNAGDPGHFGAAPAGAPLSGYARPVVGYFGAISDWFDAGLVRYLAERRPGYTFVLIGHSFGADVSALDLPNVELPGEKPYAELPGYLHCFDACIIPFKDSELIRATHPVKIYEYLAAGKPVVATDMAELRPMSELCYLASSKEDFAAKLDEAVSEDPGAAQKRKEFAGRNTWDDRFAELRKSLEGLAETGRARPARPEPLVSFIVVTWNSARYIEACLESVAGQSHPNTETVVVDNASSDETARIVREKFPGVELICNEGNAGFAEANNIGMRRARGRYVALLNPDALASPRWTETLLEELEGDASLAAASGKIFYLGEGGPDRESVFCTWPKVAPFSSKPLNFHGDEPRALVDYLSGAAMLVRREAIDRVGEMDPGYFLYFDETDWCARMIRAGYGLLYVPEAEAWHKVSPSVGADQKLHYMERSRLRFALKNFDARYMAPLFFSYAAESAAMLLRDLRRGDFGASRARCRAVAWNLASLRKTLARRAGDDKLVRRTGRARSYNGSLPLRGASP